MKQNTCFDAVRSNGMVQNSSIVIFRCNGMGKYWSFGAFRCSGMGKNTCFGAIACKGMHQNSCMDTFPCSRPHKYSCISSIACSLLPQNTRFMPFCRNGMVNFSFIGVITTKNRRRTAAKALVTIPEQQKQFLIHYIKVPPIFALSV